MEEGAYPLRFPGAMVNGCPQLHGLPDAGKYGLSKKGDRIEDTIDAKCLRAAVDKHGLVHDDVHSNRSKVNQQ